MNNNERKVDFKFVFLDYHNTKENFFDCLSLTFNGKLMVTFRITNKEMFTSIQTYPLPVFFLLPPFYPLFSFFPFLSFSSRSSRSLSFSFSLLDISIDCFSFSFFICSSFSCCFRNFSSFLILFSSISNS